MIKIMQPYFFASDFLQTAFIFLSNVLSKCRLDSRSIQEILETFKSELFYGSEKTWNNTVN